MIQPSPFIMLCLGSIGMNCVVSEPCYKWTILQRNYRKMTILWSFSYNSYVIFYGKKLGATTWMCYFLIHVISRCVIKGLHFKLWYSFMPFIWAKIWTYNIHETWQIYCVICIYDWLETVWFMSNKQYVMLCYCIWFSLFWLQLVLPWGLHQVSMLNSSTSRRDFIVWFPIYYS